MERYSLSKSVLLVIKKIRIRVLIKNIIKIPFAMLAAITLYAVLIENGWYPGLDGHSIHITYSQFWHLHYITTLYAYSLTVIAYMVRRLRTCEIFT